MASRIKCFKLRTDRLGQSGVISTELAAAHHRNGTDDFVIIHEVGFLMEIDHWADMNRDDGDFVADFHLVPHGPGVDDGMLIEDIKDRRPREFNDITHTIG